MYHILVLGGFNRINLFLWEKICIEKSRPELCGKVLTEEVYVNSGVFIVFQC